MLKYFDENSVNVLVSATGAVGDWLENAIIAPKTKNPGAVSVKDGTGNVYTLFSGGSDSVSTKHCWSLLFDGVAISGPWSVTTGAGVSLILAGGRVS